MFSNIVIKATPAWMLLLTPLWMSTKEVEAEVEEEVGETAAVTRGP